MQGFNMGRYHPPDSLDRALADKSDAAGFNRNKNGKTTQATGPPTIRFEMPFAIWCTNCKPEAIIGQGVRFNAIKTKVGNYYSTPIWAFRMRHGACGSSIEIRTDPQAGDYVVHGGARRRDYGDAQGDNGQQTLLGDVVTEADKAKRAADPFASLEGRVDQQEKAKKEGWWVEKIQERKDRDWDDVWSANRRLRQSFRVQRKALDAKEAEREEIAKRLGLHIDVLDEIEEDGQRAALMRYGDTEEVIDRKVTVNTARPLFAAEQSETTKSEGQSRTKAQKKAEKSRLLLKQSIKGNTRAVIDPFVNETQAQTSKKPLLLGIKRKRDAIGADVAMGEDDVKTDSLSISTSTPAKPQALIAYSSDTSSETG